MLVTNVAPGALPGDAVNLGQLQQVPAALRDVERIAYSGTAMAVAMKVPGVSCQSSPL